MKRDSKSSGGMGGEDMDVRMLHGQLAREQSEPWEVLRAAPAWLKHGVYAPLLIWGVIYLVNASGGFDWEEYYEGPLSTVDLAMRTPPADGPEPVSPSVATPSGPSGLPPTGGAEPGGGLREEGSDVYRAVCLACHQATGQGLPGAFPPLAGSEWVAGDDRRLALIVLHGLMGPVEVKGQPWNGAMPAQGAMLDDREIAAVLSYIRSEWGNDAPEVRPETVTAMREKFSGHAPWTVETLPSEPLEP